MGRDKGSLTETANEVNSNDSNTGKKNIQNTQRNAQSNSHRPVPRALPNHDCLPPGQLPHRSRA